MEFLEGFVTFFQIFFEMPGEEGGSGRTDKPNDTTHKRYSKGSVPPLDTTSS